MAETAIFHLAVHDLWDAAQRTGEPYIPAEYAADGFVHCSTAAQVADTANLYYSGRHDLVLLEIDAARLGDALVWESGAGDRTEPFPHVYGPIAAEAVNAVHAFEPDQDGTFRR